MQLRPPLSPFSVMAKPIGPSCNLDCRYCYYLDKDRLYPEARSWRMGAAVLERFVRDTIAANEGPEITFSWQGGEPTLLGRGFFERALALQRRHCPPGKTILNALQTNGTLLDAGWADFLRDNGFLVGISIDGPRPLHDRYRVTRKGGPTFDAVLAALRLLRDAAVEFNTLTVVHRGNARAGGEVYRFLRDEGVRFMQFIPAVERCGDDGALVGPPDAGPPDAGPPGAEPPGAETAAAVLTPWSVPPRGYGDFMCAVFDQWVRRDVGTVFVQLFDVQLGLRSGLPSALCTFAETCGPGPALEHNGDLYACDHYVYPGYRLGNIVERPIGELVRTLRQQEFGDAKRDTLAEDCRRCEFLFACNGGCPKHRFAHGQDGAPGMTYLCPSYRRFFAHPAAHMNVMAELVRAGQPAALVSGLVGPDGRMAKDGRVAKTGRNAPCPCGSGAKFKRCCGASPAGSG